MSSGPVMIMAGGTGGHVFPGLAVAEVLRSRDRAVVWLGTHRGIEARVVPAQGIDVHWISIAGVRGRGLAAWLAAPFKIVAAIVQALGAVRRSRPSVVLGMGGFVAGPGGIAAWLARRPLLIHEQNAVAGTTNRLLARFATRVLEGFPRSFRSGIAAETVGNPVRREIAVLAATTRPADTEPRRRRLLVFGGSQGALALNECLPGALARLDPSVRPSVRHQAGRSMAAAAAAYAAAGIEADLVEFIEDMAEAYTWADLVVARAGASTIAELAAAGVGAILVPLPHAIDDHQTRNAEHFVGAGAGTLVPQAALSEERLAQELERCLSAPALLESMATAARSQARPEAAERIADLCLELAQARA